jgi:predicted ATPase
MITHVRIQNFLSFLDASVDLQPFSLVLGANGSGKTNFLKFFQAISTDPNLRPPKLGGLLGRKHQNAPNQIQRFEVTDGSELVVGQEVRIPGRNEIHINGAPEWLMAQFPIFNINPDKVSMVETTVPHPRVKGDGEGTCQVLDALKNGDHEDLFDAVEESFRRYVPEVQKLSLKTVQEGKKQIQVRERGLKEPTPGPELSEGTRLILCILTILHQEEPPNVILLEDVDRGMHPRLFEYVAPLMRDIAQHHGINIIATSHNPYLVDCFRDVPEAAILVEKKDGVSTLTTFAQRLDEIDYDSVDREDAPLGQLWYSGIIGGVPIKGNK